MPYGAAADPRTRVVRQIIDNAPDYLDLPLVTTAIIESNLNPGATGDHGQSSGVFQEYSQGRGAGIPIEARREVTGATKRAAREFQTFYDRGARGASLAYRAQRPADQASYTTNYNKAVTEARRLIAQAGGATGAVVPPGAGQRTEASAGGRPQSTLGDSLASAVAGRAPGERLITAVMRGALQSSLSGGASPERAQQSASAAATAASAIGTKAQNQVISAALKQKGTPYSWGGGTPAGPGRGFAQGANTTGFDCSSLVQFAWAKAGVALPRTTYQQIRVGTAVPNLQHVQPGDLLFPSKGHVMMAIGNGKAIEAPHTGAVVRVVPLSSRPSYIAIRRPA